MYLTVVNSPYNETCTHIAHANSKLLANHGFLGVFAMCKARVVEDLGELQVIDLKMALGNSPCKNRRVQWTVSQQ